MDAMILAAGLGTRLGAVTERTPKALVTVGGVTMLERIAQQLVAAGADRIILNTHHFADQIREFVELRHNFGVDVCFKWEREEPLETGGGLLNAADCFRGDAPFFLHNADIITDIDLGQMYRTHLESDALVTLAVHERASSRRLLFDERGLYGRTVKDEVIAQRAPVGATTARAFAGVHVASPQLLERITERGKFTILDPYLRLAALGERIQPFDVTGGMWLEIGTPERLEEARRRLE